MFWWVFFTDTLAVSRHSKEGHVYLMKTVPSCSWQDILNLRTGITLKEASEEKPASFAVDLFCAGRSLLPVTDWACHSPDREALPSSRSHRKPRGCKMASDFPGRVTHSLEGRQSLQGRPGNANSEKKKKKITTVYRKRNENYFPHADSESSDEAVAVLTVDRWHISHVNNICQNSFQRKRLKHREVV